METVSAFLNIDSQVYLKKRLNKIKSKCKLKRTKLLTQLWI